MTRPTTIEDKGDGRVPAAPGSRPSDQAPAGLDASRVDPSRDYVNEFFRRFYPPDFAEAWETEPCAGSYARRYRGQFKESHDTVFPFLICADGYQLSVQGHFGAYSTPRDDFADQGYSCVEVMVSPPLPEFGQYLDGVYDGNAVYGYVPVSLVNALIADHGGLARDSGGGPKGEAGTAECEAPQSGGSEASASPNPSSAIASKAEGR